MLVVEILVSERISLATALSTSNSSNLVSDYAGKDISIIDSKSREFIINIPSPPSYIILVRLVGVLSRDKGIYSTTNDSI